MRTGYLIVFFFLASLLITPLFLLPSSFSYLSPAVLAADDSVDDGDPYDILPADPEQKIPNPLKVGTLQEVVASIINVAYSLAAMVAIIYIIIGGYQFITSAGNPDIVEQAKSTITNAIIGLLIIVLSYLFIHFILTSIGAGGLIPELT